jgi:hypothetical protein
MNCIIDDNSYEAACNELKLSYLKIDFINNETIKLNDIEICKIITKYGILSKPFQNKTLRGYWHVDDTCMNKMLMGRSNGVKYIGVFGVLWKLTDKITEICIIFTNSSIYNRLYQSYKVYHIKINKLILIHGKY